MANYDGERQKSGVGVESSDLKVEASCLSVEASGLRVEVQGMNVEALWFIVESSQRTLSADVDLMTSLNKFNDALWPEMPRDSRES